MEGKLLSVEIDPFRIGDLVRYIYYDWDSASQLPGGNPSGVEKSNLAFIIDIVDDPDEKQVELFRKVLIYDTRLQKTVLTHTHSIEFISRAT